ncbi:MAG: restriction endonuclease subunit S [Leptolyngbya sp. Prado105]|nr:restriction endonuclease subunit S [Leptolyngbya sp. Prado105]
MNTSNLELIDPQFLSYYFRTNQIAQQAQALSKGAAAISKLTLNPPQFWDLTISLPPLDEQKLIAAKIEKLMARLEEAQELRSKAIKAAKVLLTTAITQALEGIPIDGQLADVLLEKPRNGWSARCDNVETGVAVLSLGAVTGFTYRSQEFKRTSEPTAEDAHYWLQEGDLLITRSNTPELVGHAAIYDGFPSPCIYPDLMMRLAINEKRASKKFIHYWLRSIFVRDYIFRSAKGTSPTMKKITQGTVMSIPFPSSLSPARQRCIIKQLDDLQVKVDMFKQLQFETETELNALLPSILNKAFKGEL